MSTTRTESLHDAAAHAIADAIYPPGGLLSESAWRECEAAAAAVIGLCVAASQAEAKKPDIECCPVCRGVFEHVLGCPEQDRPR